MCPAAGSGWGWGSGSGSGGVLGAAPAPIGSARARWRRGPIKAPGPLRCRRRSVMSPPALPWLLAACCLCALPRGSGTSRRQRGGVKGGGGWGGHPRKRPPLKLWEGSSPARGRCRGWAPRHLRPALSPLSPQASPSLPHATGTAWTCPKARYDPLCLPCLGRGGGAGQSRPSPGLAEGGGKRGSAVAGGCGRKLAAARECCVKSRGWAVKGG